MTGVSLRRLQRWFAYVVEHPATADVAIAEPAAAALVPTAQVLADRVLTPNRRLGAAGMLQIYNGAYLERLVGVLQADFGCVQHVLGEPAFRALVARYVAAHPSRHANLNQFGRAFPAFVQAQRRLPHRAFVAELARLERELGESFDAPAAAALAADALAQVPQDRWGEARFTPHPSLCVLAFRHPVDVFYQAWKDAKPMAVPAPERSWLAVCRRDDRVWRHRLQPVAHRVLLALVAGEPLAKALAVAKRGEPVAQGFRDFAQGGMFADVRL